MKHRDYMKIALNEAIKAKKLGEVPVGAVIVKDNEVIATGYNLVQTKNNSTLHAEIVAINRACKKLNSKWLTDCTLYVTLEPCSMCAGAIVHSRLKRVVIGCEDFKQGAFMGMYNLLNYSVNHKPEILFGILEDESRNILKEFFKDLR